MTRARPLFILLLTLLLSACGGTAAPASTPERVEVPVEVTRIVEVEGTPIVQTETIVVTATPATPTEEGVGNDAGSAAQESPPAGGDTGAEAEGAATEAATSEPATGEPLPEPTGVAPAPSRPTTVAPRPTITVVAEVPPTTTPPLPEARVVELEWPARIRLGDSDQVRLTLVPSDAGYLLTTEFPENRVVTETVAIQPQPGYDLLGVATLDTPPSTFDLSPAPQQRLPIAMGEAVTWRWTLAPRRAGRHRLAVTLALRWEPQPGNPAPARESQLYSRAVTIQAASFLGLTMQQATMSGLAGLLLGSTMTFPLAARALRPHRTGLRRQAPNTHLRIEHPPTFTLTPEERGLLGALFHTYERLSLEAEFRSGYSGARIFLALPTRPDGRADAFTIAKLSERGAIEQEFSNFETFVKHTLPPITARIQDTPVALPRRASQGAEPELAALRYTFIGEPGRMPVSLRQALLAESDPDLLERLFSTFGPNWWMQRRPNTFRVAEEYDRMLPSHFVVEPVEGVTPISTLDGREPPSRYTFEPGAVVTLHNLRVVERQPGEGDSTLVGTAVPGHPPLRLRLRGSAARSVSHEGLMVRIVATRASLLHEWTHTLDPLGLPDPLALLSSVLQEQVFGTTSPIHGDLNLENVLVGPGGFVWLIDFALTREGHPLYDFAHLAADTIAHILALRYDNPRAFLTALREEREPLLRTLDSIARRCLFNPAHPREYHLACFVTFLGALKYRNLSDHQRHLLYLAAAHMAAQLMDLERNV